METGINLLGETLRDKCQLNDQMSIVIESKESKRSIFERSTVRKFANGACARTRGSLSRVWFAARLTRRHVVGAAALCVVKLREVDCATPSSQCRFERCRVRVVRSRAPWLPKAAAISSRRRRSLLQRTFRVGAVHIKPPKFYEERSMSINSSLSLSNSESSKKPIMPSLISSNW